MHLTLRLPDDLLGRLDGFQRARGFADRSQAVRAAIREAAMSPEERATVPDRDELLRLLGVRAREGNVAAIRLLLAELRRADETSTGNEFSFIDELAGRRAATVDVHG